MSQCPFCKSEKVECINEIEYLKPNQYEKKEGNTNTIGSFNLFCNEFACLHCGMVFKNIPGKLLKDYIDMKPYFKK